MLVVMLLSMGAALAQTVAADRRARAQVEETTDVLTLLRRSLLAGIDAETGQRGYLLTGNPVFLDSYERGSKDWLLTLAELHSVLQDRSSPEETAVLARLEQLATAKLANMDETIDLARAGRRDEALAIVASQIGKRLMDDYRDAESALEEQHAARQRQAIDEAHEVDARAVPVVFLVGASMFGLIIVGLWLERRASRAEAAALELERRDHERSKLLSRELNHRVKNLFAVVLSIVSLTARGETDVKRAVANIQSRIYALSLAHTASQGPSHDGTVPLNELIASILKPYAGHRGGITIEGEAIALPARFVTPLGLIIHELATNAAKYGALSAEDGSVAVRWTSRERTDGNELELVWDERNGPAVAPERQDGFGTALIQQSSLQMGGRVDRAWLPRGLRATLVLSLEDHG